MEEQWHILMSKYKVDQGLSNLNLFFTHFILNTELCFVKYQAQLLLLLFVSLLYDFGIL